MSIEEKLTDLGGADKGSVNPLDLPINGMTSVIQQAAGNLKASGISPVMDKSFSGNPMAVGSAPQNSLAMEQFNAIEGLKISSAITGQDIGGVSHLGHVQESLGDMLTSVGNADSELFAEMTAEAKGFLADIAEGFQEAMGEMADKAGDMLQNGPDILAGTMQAEPMVAAAQHAAKDIQLS